jgi:threonylcarbamoyladenosine tRNA methylthiotransferase MtaB
LAIETALADAGFGIKAFPSRADAYIINTCTVTDRTDSRSRQAIRRARRLNPDATVVVTGCYAQVSPTEIEGLDAVDFILGNPDKDRVLQCLTSGLKGNSARTRVSDYKSGAPLAMRARPAGGRARANIKVQDGCDKRCSYCIIPFARGASKSLGFDDVSVEMDSLVADGFSEVVLTGIHLGAWGRDFKPRMDIVDLVLGLERQGAIKRIRISSLDPDEVTDELIALMRASSVICNHLHLPLQSGDDSVLALMKRSYSARDFSDTTEKLVKNVPGINVGTDVIVGFPGETDEAFENTYKLLETLPLGYLHVFPYSRRSGTPAAAFANQTPPGVIRERALRLNALDAVMRGAFYEKFVGTKARVLVEMERDKARLTGKTRNYIPVLIEGTEGPEADWLKKAEAEVMLTGLAGRSMTGKLTEAHGVHRRA